MKFTFSLRTVSQFVALAAFLLGPQVTARALEQFRFNQSQAFSQGLDEVAAAKAAQAAEDEAEDEQADDAQSDDVPAAQSQADISPIEGTTSAPVDDATGPHFDEVELVRERYPDGKVKIERQVTLDSQGNYVNHGAWRLYSQTETVIAEGQFDMGQRVGAWTHWINKAESAVFGEYPLNRFKAPFASQATFNKGVMDGEWIVTDADSRKMLQVSLCEGQRHGMVVIFMPNGKTFRQASYDHGVPVGDVMELDAKSGELKRTATYIDGRRITTKTAHYPRGKQKKSEEMFLAATTVQKTADNFWTVALATYGTEGKDLRHGPSKLWFENGQSQVQGVYEHDKRAGEFTYWYANGQVAATGKFENDLPCGSWVWWHSNGQKSGIGKYTDGAMIGEWRYWEESGKLTKQQTFDGTQIVKNPVVPNEPKQHAKVPREIRLGSRPSTNGRTVK